MNRFLSLAIVAICCALGTADARAQRSCQGSPPALPWFVSGYGGSLYGLGYVPVPPYFALHPPVYYSHVAARTYGQSPFAAWHPAPPTPAPRPRLIVNPFAVHPSDAASQPPTQAYPASTGIILNPHYQPNKPGVAPPKPATDEG